MTIEVTIKLYFQNKDRCEVFKSIKDLNPTFISEMFHINHTGYNLRNEIVSIAQLKYKKVMYGHKTFTYYGLHLWNKLPRN